MTRTEFVRAYEDLKRGYREKSGIPFSSKQESEAHIADHNAAAAVWRKNKNRLQGQSADEWRKKEVG